MEKIFNEFETEFSNFKYIQKTIIEYFSYKIFILIYLNVKA